MSSSDDDKKHEVLEIIEEVEEELSMPALSITSSTEKDSSVDWEEDATSSSAERVSVFKDPKAWLVQNYLSWRFYMTIYAALGIICVLIHVVAVAAAAVMHGVDEDGNILLFQGSYAKAHRISLFAHFFMSSIACYMLCSSAYAMYCLTPPTRDEIDIAHAQGNWLDIGCMSLRNLRHIGKKRVFLFVSLGLTSPILQLFYNAILFLTYPANEYMVVLAHESFRTASVPAIDLAWNITQATVLDDVYTPLINGLHTQMAHDQLVILDNKACLEIYGQTLQMTHSHLVVITEDSPLVSADVFAAMPAPIVSEYKVGPEQYSWMCPPDIANTGQCLWFVENLKKNAATWELPTGEKVKYCMSEPTPERVKLSFNVQLLVLCLLVALFKAVMMFAVAFWVHEAPLMTTGDAISSFMGRPDPYTRDMCLTTKKSIQRHRIAWPKWPLAFSNKQKRLMTGIETRVQYLTLVMLIALCGAASLFTLMNESVSVTKLMSLGLGVITRDYFIGWNWSPGPIARSIVVANAGHAIYGIIYVLYCNIFYCMVFSDEWARYASHRKGLRVSERTRGAQRNVHFFLMPQKIAWPIMFFSVGIHTLISQTAFLVNVEAYGSGLALGDMTLADAQGLLVNVRQRTQDFNTTGFSPLGNCGLLICGLLMVIFLLATGARRYQTAIPVASTCSAAISAACHPAKGERSNFHLHPVQWGVVSRSSSISTSVGHCAFSSRDVSPAEESRLYC